MNKIQAFMGDFNGAARAIIVSPQSAVTCRHITQSIGAIVLKENGQNYAPNKLGWVKWRDRDGVDHEDAEQNYSITLRTEFGLDLSVLTPSRQFPLEAVEKIATVKPGDPVFVQSRKLASVVGATIIGTVNRAQSTIECDYRAEGGTFTQPGDSGSLVTNINGDIVGFVSSVTDSGCLITIPGIPELSLGSSWSEGRADPVPEPILVPTNPTSPYTPPDGSSSEFKSGVIWERNRAFSAAQKRLDLERSESLSTI